jgi:PAS domain-containing protein
VTWWLGGAMTGSEIDYADYAAVFRDFPGPVALLTPDFAFADANLMYLEVAGRDREDLLGSNVFAVFPDNPADPDAAGSSNVRASLERVLATGERDSMPLQRYDVEVPGSPGVFEERYWSTINTPIFGPDGHVKLIAHRVEEVTLIARQLLELQVSSA